MAKKGITTPSEKLTTSGVLMSGFFKGLPLFFSWKIRTAIFKNFESVKVTDTIRGFSLVLISLSNNDVKFIKTYNEFKVYFIPVIGRANHGPWLMDLLSGHSCSEFLMTVKDLRILNGWWTGKLPEMKVDLTEHIETIRISKWAELPNDLAVDFLNFAFSHLFILNHVMVEITQTMWYFN